MIDLSQELILSLIIKAFLTGVLLGVAYEAVRMLRMLFGIRESEKKLRVPSLIFLFVTDLLFCLLFALSAILLTYNISGGVFRGCVYVCMAVGLLIYRFTLGVITEKIERVITNIIKKILRQVLRVTLIPIRAIFSLCRRIYALTIGRIIGKIRCRIIAARKERGNTPPCDGKAAETEEEEKDAKGATGYRKEGRISFGGRYQGNR